MKRIRYILSLAVLAVLASCNPNEMPEFNDNDAFVAFDNASMSVEENAQTLSIPVTLASIKGISASVTYTLLDGGTAVEDSNFTFADANKTLTFDATHRTQYIVVNIINKPGVFTGDLRFKLQLSDDGTIKPNAENVCTITITDLDHPLAAILGTWTATGTSYFNGSESWDMELTKDPSDVTVVWFYPFVNGGSGYKIYGVVNDAKTEIRVPVGQEIAPPGSYGFIELKGFYGPSGEEEIPDGGYITITIEPNKLSIKDEIGSYVWGDAGQTSGLGWYNIFKADVVLTR